MGHHGSFRRGHHSPAETDARTPLGRDSCLQIREPLEEPRPVTTSVDRTRRRICRPPSPRRATSERSRMNVGDARLRMGGSCCAVSCRGTVGSAVRLHDHDSLQGRSGTGGTREGERRRGSEPRGRRLIRGSWSTCADMPTIARATTSNAAVEALKSIGTARLRARSFSAHGPEIADRSSARARRKHALELTLEHVTATVRTRARGANARRRLPRSSRLSHLGREKTCTPMRPAPFLAATSILYAIGTGRIGQSAPLLPLPTTGLFLSFAPEEPAGTL